MSNSSAFLYADVPVGLCYLDAELRYVDINEWLARLNGISVADHIGHTVDELMPELAVRIVPQFQRVLTTGEPVINGSALAETPAHPGTQRLYEHSYYPRKDENGSVIGISCLVEDVSERDRLVRRYRDLFENAIDMIHIVDRAGQLTAINQTELTKLGYTAEEIVGKPLADIIHPDFRDATGRAIRKVLAGETIDSYETALKTRDGDLIPTLVNAVPIIENGKTVGAHAILRDITTDKEFERRKLLMSELDHRVKNNLAAILSLLRQTAKSVGSIDELVEAFGGRLRGMAATHEALARQQWDPMAVAELVRSTLDLFASVSDQVRIAGSSGILPSSFAQPFGMALYEIVLNAHKHGALSVREGRVTISWEFDKNGTLMFAWTEEGGPPVGGPIHDGMGHRLVKGLIEHEIGGTATAAWPTKGVRWSLTIPIEANQLIPSTGLA